MGEILLQVLAYMGSEICSEKLFSILLGCWIALQWGALTFVHNDMWWGGWGYGSRLLVETIPAWIVLSVMILSKIDLGQHLVVRWLVLLCLIFGAYVNILQPLYNKYVVTWNMQPDVDLEQRTLWDWSYPPSLHNEERHLQRMQKYLNELKE